MQFYIDKNNIISLVSVDTHISGILSLHTYFKSKPNQQEFMKYAIYQFFAFALE